MKLAIASICLFTVNAAAEPVRLEHRFSAEEPVWSEMSQIVQTNQVADGQSTRTTIRNTQRMRTELVERRGDDFVVENTVEAIRLTMSGPGYSVNYDSEKPARGATATDPIVAGLAAMKGRGVRLLLTPDGRILDIPNFADLKTEVDALPDPAAREGAGRLLRRDVMVAMNELNYKVLPEGPVEPGERWSRSFQIPTELGLIGMDVGLTLDRVVEEDGRRIAEISMDGAADLSPAPGLGMEAEVSRSEITGSLRFDVDAGFSVSMEMTTAIRIGLRHPGDRNASATSRIVQTIKVRSLDR